MVQRIEVRVDLHFRNVDAPSDSLVKKAKSSGVMSERDLAYGGIIQISSFGFAYFERTVKEKSTGIKLMFSIRSSSFLYLFIISLSITKMEYENRKATNTSTNHSVFRQI